MTFLREWVPEPSKCPEFKRLISTDDLEVDQTSKYYTGVNYVQPGLGELINLKEMEVPLESHWIVLNIS